MDLILFLKYLFLGLFQGFTEPIPISSSGHLVLAQHIFGLKIEGMSFELLVNFGSLLAVLAIYWESVKSLTLDSIGYITTRRSEYRGGFRYVLLLIVATIPAGIAGVLFEDEISVIFKDVRTISIALLITAVALFLIRNLRGTKSENEITFVDALIIGLAQMVALIPGISRSGATIVAAMGRGFQAKAALKFSFFLFIPVSLGGMLLSITDIIYDPQIHNLWPAYLAAFIGSTVMSYFSLKWFMYLMEKGNLIIFSIYCVIVGVTTFFLL